jgi:hypothetical protein
MIFNQLILLNYFSRLEAGLHLSVYNAKTPAGDDAAGATFANRRDCTC